MSPESASSSEPTDSLWLSETGNKIHLLKAYSKNSSLALIPYFNSTMFHSKLWYFSMIQHWAGISICCHTAFHRLILETLTNTPCLTKNEATILYKNINVTTETHVQELISGCFSQYTICIDKFWKEIKFNFNYLTRTK